MTYVYRAQFSPSATPGPEGMLVRPRSDGEGPAASGARWLLVLLVALSVREGANAADGPYQRLGVARPRVEGVAQAVTKR